MSLRNFLIYQSYTRGYSSGYKRGRQDGRDRVDPYVFDLVNALRTGEPLDFHGHEVPQEIQAALEAPKLTSVPLCGSMGPRIGGEGAPTCIKPKNHPTDEKCEPDPSWKTYGWWK